MHRYFLPLVLLAALLLGACGPSTNDDDIGPLPGVASAVPNAGTSQQPTAAADGVTISFATWENDRAIIEQLASTFHTENPGITVVAVSMDDLMNNSDAAQDAVSQLRRLVSGADTAPSYGIQPETVNANLVLDLKPLMDADSSFKRDDYYPGALERGSYGTATLMLPRYVYAQLLSYNKSLFKAANLPEPAANWTWTDLLGASEQIASSNSEAYGFFDYSSGFTALLADAEQRKLKLTNVPPADIDFTAPEFVDLVAKAKQRVDSRVILPANQKDGQPQPQQFVRDGLVAIFPADALTSRDGSQDVGSLSFEVGAIPYPRGEGILSANNSGTEGYMISAGTKHPNEAWKWIDYLSRQQTDQQGASSYPGRIPARQSLAETTNYWNSIDAGNKAAYLNAVAQPTQSLDRTPDYTVVGTLYQAVDDVVSRGAKPEKALRTAQDMLKQQLAEQVQLTPTPKPETGPVVVATPVQQTAPEGANVIAFNTAGNQASVYRQLARQFNEQNNGSFVQIKSTQAFTEPVSIAGLAQQNDCFLNYSSPQSQEDFAALLDLNPLINSDASFKRDDYPQAVLGQFINNGGLYGLPYSFNIRVLGYNKTLFNAVGQAAPSDSWKPDDFLAAAKALTSGTGDKKIYGYVPYGSGPSGDMLFFINQFGGQLSTGSGSNAKPNFADPKVVAAIQWYIDLAKVHGVMPKFTLPYRPSDTSDDRSYDLIQRGQGAMWLDFGGGSFGDTNNPESAASSLAWEPTYAPLPVGGAGLQSSDLYARGIFISASSKQQQGCWQWLKFLSNDITDTNGDYPARISITQSDAFAATASLGKLAIYQAYSEALSKQSTINPGINALYAASPMGVDLYWFNKAIDETIEKDANLAEGLKTANELTTKHLACVIETKKPATCAKQVDPEYDGYNTEDPDLENPGVRPAG